MAAGLSRAGPARRSPCRYGNGSFPKGGALHAGGGLAERRAVRRRGRAGVRHGRGVTGRAAPVPPGGRWEPVEDLGEGVRRMEPGSSRWQPVVWEIHGQREQMLRREKEQQVARLLWQRQDARQERAELLAQHQQRLSALEQQHQLEQLQRLHQHLTGWTEPGWGLGDLMAHGAPSWPSSPALDPNTQSEEQQIFRAVLRIPSEQGRHKAFSTCVPHLTVVSLFVNTGVFAFLKPLSISSPSLDLVVSFLYSLVPPAVNPLTYSMRNQELKVALKKVI
ncbi:uncharacterized protein LOC136002966 [Caloenas nicobarica]|uniref:uncharacterized protein LOC136002966 n=1 Tax=Caloenas nicobarica TaxID=187106 RepID=UPI0032B75A5D